MKFARLVTALLLCLAANTSSADQVRIAVAANFTEAVRLIVPAFETATGHIVVPSFGSTGKFYAQIANGAPFDLLLSADEDTPRRLIAAGLAVPGTRLTYASGRLALWSAAPGAVDARGDVLKRRDFARLAIANPKVAPYGAAAEAALKKLGVYGSVSPRLVQGENIAQTFQFVSTRNAQLGFVALAQVLALKDDKRGSWWVVPSNLHPPIRQDAVLLHPGESKPAARAFLDFLKDPQVKRIITALGYGVTP
jgi:molybdate transport system substrate-binding protein